MIFPLTICGVIELGPLDEKYAIMGAGTLLMTGILLVQ